MKEFKFGRQIKHKVPPQWTAFAPVYGAILGLLLIWAQASHAADLTVKADAITTNNPAKTTVDVKKNLDLQTTGGVYLPSGTTAQQPTPYKAGMLRYNSTIGAAEIYSGGVWGEIGGSTTIADWVASTDYEAGEFVIESLKLYRALLNHTASLSFATDLANGDWEEISPTGTIDLTSGVTGVLPISNGGTGSGTKNFVDLTTNQTIAGDKTFTNDVNISGITSIASSNTGPLKAVSGVVSAGNINVASEVTGVLPIANGGTGNTSGTATINANLTGEVTSVGNAATVTNAAVIAKTLTGFASAAGTITNADSILSAIQKLDGNVALKLGLTKSDADVGAVVTTQLNVPSDQLTDLGSNVRRIETGNKNLLKNPGMEAAAVSGWSCSLGTASVSNNTLNPGSVFLGTNSLKVVSTGAGIRCYQSLTGLNTALSGQQMNLELQINNSDPLLQVCSLEGGTTAAFDFNCKYVPVSTAAVPWQLVSIPFIGNGTSNGIVIKSATTTAQNIYADVAHMGPGLGRVSLTPSTDFVPCTFSTLAWQGLGTVTNSLECKRDGDVLRMRGRVDLGTVSASQAQFPLPSNWGALTIKSTIPANSSGNIFFRGVSSVGVLRNVVLQPSVNYFQTSREFVSTANPVFIAAPGDTFANADALIFPEISIPIAQWSGSSSSAYLSTNTFPTILTARNTTSQTTGTTMTGWTVQQDTKSAFNASTGVFTAQEDATFEITHQVTGASGTTGYLACQITAGGTNYLGPYVVSTAAVGSQCSNTLKIFLSRGQTISFATQGSATTGIASLNIISIQRVDNNLIVGSFENIEKCANAYECENTFSAKISKTGVVSNESLDWINGGCVVSATSTFTCTLLTTLKDGTSALSSPLNCNITTGEVANGFTYRISPTSTTQIIYHTNGNTPSDVAQDVEITCSKGTNDFKPKTAKIASSIGVPTVPGIVGVSTGERIDTFFASYGTTNATTACTASPCSYLDQIGSAISSITRAGAGSYSVVTAKTYAKLKCVAIAHVPAVGGGTVDGGMSCSNCTSVALTTRNAGTAVGTDTYGNVMCQGTY